MGFCGLEADSQEAGDLLRRLALRDELQDLALSGRQRVARYIRLGQVGFDDRLRDAGAQVHHAFQHFVDRTHQVGRDLGLDDIPLDARPDRLQDVMVVRVHREENRLGPRAGVKDLPGSVQSIQQRHGEIQDRHVRAARARLTERLLAVAGFRDNGEPFPLQQGFQALPDDRVVIREENPIRHCPPPPVR